MKKYLVIPVLVLSLLCSNASAQSKSDLEKSFDSPSQSARPRVWWHWMNGNISKEGIHKDLLWMSKSGIAGFHAFDAGLSTPQVVPHRIEYMTPEWKDAFRYALDQADSLGMEVTIASSPGWSETGGPWVTEDEAMKKIVWRQFDVENWSGKSGKATSFKLPEGFNVSGLFQDDPHVSWDEDLKPEYYRDIAVMAVKLPDSYVDFSRLNSLITTSCSSTPVAYDVLNSDSIRNGVVLHTGSDCSAWIQYAFDSPQTVKAVVVSELKAGDKFSIARELLASDDGEHFRKVADLGYQATIQKTYSIPTATAKYFRLVFKDTQKLASCDIELYQFMLSSIARVQDAGDKAAEGFYRKAYLEKTQPDMDVPRTSDIIDLTDNVKDGVLTWKVPAGKWRIFRFGYSLYGKCNHPASPEATGLEVDKMDPVATEKYYRNYLATYQDASGGRLGPGGIEYLLTDSYEAGPQTWTVRMPEEFKARKGYDLMRWLPALTGMVLNSPEETERFLFDWRRCIGDMIAEYHYDIQNRILDEFGMKRYTESHEAFLANMADGMDIKHKAQVPMSAFWMSYKQGRVMNPWHVADIRESASVSHIYGQGVVAAESFTSNGNRDGAWVFSPARLKGTADAAMAAGLNRFVVHCSTHQPVDSLLPGLGLGIWGQWFTRNQTWADKADVWTGYLSRSCELLQKGSNVADIAVFYGEDHNITGIFRNGEPEGVAAGWNYDYFNPTVLLTLATAEDGRICIPGGPSYSVLTIDPCVTRASIPVLRKIKELADAGVLICGSAPTAVGGMDGTKQEFDSLVADIWKSGRKNVSTGVPTAKVLTSAGVGQDVSCPGIGKDILFVHRSLGDGREIYWLCNQTPKAVDTNVRFRVTGMKPEFWHADYDTKEDASYTIGADGTDVAVSLEPYGSVFVMFLDKAGRYSAVVKKAEPSEQQTVSGPWKVAFQQGRGAPESIVENDLKSLSEFDEPGVKYFSGWATYTNTFNVSDLKSVGRVVLDLGQVYDMAEVIVNGKSVRTLWHAPYEVDVTEAVSEGTNSLEIRVVNTWYNRILGDMQPGVEKKITWYAEDLLKASDPVLPSGLVGPVVVKSFDNRSDLASPAGPEWLKTATFYEIYPLTFKDSDGDGVGDLKGITSKLEYVKSLGVNAIWFNPMFCSEFQDAGYDITDYYRVDPRFGTNDDLVELLHKAHELGMKVCLDLVAGHSSDKCDWFKESSRERYGRYSDYYIWVDKLDAAEQKAYDSGKSNFVKSDSPRGGYYVKNFYDCQPALNYGYAYPDPSKPWQQGINDPGPKAVRRELMNIMSFWMDLGFDGFRVDMASSLVKNDGKEKPVTKTIWHEIRAWMDKNYPENILIAEWSNPLNSIPAGFHVDFVLPWTNTHSAELFHPAGIRYNRTAPCWFDLSGKGTAKNFLAMFQKYYDRTRDLGFVSVPTSNHDQPRPNLRDRNTPDQLKVIMTFTMTMPGIPIIYYGDELGMRYVEGLPDKEGSGTIRAGSRTPMQWDDDLCAGFSTCEPSQLYLPVFPKGEDGTTSLTVAAEDGNPESLLNFTRSLIKLRESSDALGNCGAWKLLSDPELAYPMVYERTAGNERYVIVLNPSAATVKTTLVPSGATPVSVVGKYSFRKGTLTAGGVSALIFKCQ